ncbi:MAG: hypothetical protein ACYC0V_18810, partial [Armatimonadota bacterium]
NPKGSKQWYLPDSRLWDYFKILNNKINDFTPVIINGNSIGPAKSDNNQIYTNVWKWNKNTYIIAVNPTDKLMAFALSELEAKSADVIGENRGLSIKVGTLHDTFEPLGVHVYQLK